MPPVLRSFVYSTDLDYFPLPVDSYIVKDNFSLRGTLNLARSLHQKPPVSLPLEVSRVPVEVGGQKISVSSAACPQIRLSFSPRVLLSSEEEDVND